MKDFLKRNGLWVLFAVAVIAVSLAVMSFFTTTSSPLANAAQVITSPFRTAFTAVADWFNDKQAYYADYKALEEENQELKDQIAKMERSVRQAEADSAENERLRELLNLRPQEEKWELESATILERSSSNWTRSFTLSKGTDCGIAVYDAVITSEGFLVGTVSEVGTNWCTVLCITDTDTSLGALVFRTDEIGVAEGDFQLMDQSKLKLSYLSPDAQLLNGDLIVTSGLGGFLPSGLVIGSVEEVKLDDSGSTQYAVLQPSADFDALTEVFVIKDFTVVE